MKPDLLHVVAVVSNPVRFGRRAELFRHFIDHMLASGVRLTVVELAYGDRDFDIAPREGVNIVQLRTRDELWHKENLINAGVQRLPPDWKYVAWVDGDVTFTNPDWATQTVDQLQHYDVVQLFDFAEDVGLAPHQHLNIERGFVHRYHAMLRECAAGGTTPTPPHGKHPYGGWFGHCGYAWAMRRSAWNKLGGLFDLGILGSGDHHMACALVGAVQSSVPVKVSLAYRKHLALWEARARRHIVQNIGYVPGKLLHHFHGPKAQRQYVERWQILLRNDFDPETDLKRDWQGLWSLTGNKPQLRDELRLYFRQRNEDSNDLGGVRA